MESSRPRGVVQEDPQLPCTFVILLPLCIKENDIDEPSDEMMLLNVLSPQVSKPRALNLVGISPPTPVKVYFLPITHSGEPRNNPDHPKERSRRTFPRVR